MSKPFRVLSAVTLGLAASLTAFAEPAALGRVGIGGNDTSAANVACLSCSESSKQTPGAGSARGGATNGVVAFRPNSGAGTIIQNGVGVDTALGNTKDPVPEPATIGLVGAGLAALAFGLKRRS